MTCREEHLYTLVFEKIKSLFNQRNINLTQIMCDYELGLRNSARVSFENVSVLGCYFHFSQAVLKKVSSLGFSGIYRSNEGIRNCVRKLLVLPLLSPQNIYEGLRIITNDGPGELERLFGYFQLQWMLVSEIGFHPNFGNY